MKIRVYAALCLALCLCLCLGKRRVLEEEAEEEWELGPDGEASRSSTRLWADPARYLVPRVEAESAQQLRQYAAVHDKSLDTHKLLAGHHLSSPASQKKSFGGEALLYVTPWHRRGYEEALHVALTRSRRGAATLVAPAWFQLRSSADGGVAVEGQHEVDSDWLAQLKALGAGAAVKVVPRVSVEMTLDLQGQQVMQAAAALHALLQRLQEQGSALDGLTLEIPLDQLEAAVALPRALRALHGEDAGKLLLVLVLPPIEVPAHNGPEAEHAAKVLGSLAAGVDRLSVMTYDRARDGSPIAPLPWVRRVMQSLQSLPALQGKLLLGVPFYGWRSEGLENEASALTSEQLVTWLADENVRIEWDPQALEHSFTDDAGRVASFPSPAMLRARLALVQELGLQGVAVWELGQGLATCADLL